LQHGVSFKLFQRNEFAATTIYGAETPWGGKLGHELKDIDVVRIKHWLARNFRYEPQDKIILDAVAKIADENKFHPVRDYLNALSDWDGRCRVENFLEVYFNAKGDPRYLRAVSRKVLCAMIARILEPGTKFDYVLILEGNQGIGKSTAIRALSGDHWFTDAHINISDKDGVLALQSVWLVELGELGGMRKADADQLKEFISRTTDRIRLPYGKLVETFPRQCVFIGTTNSAEYLKDMTGNRRFWPVEVGFCDFEAIRRDRDQILAEAMWIWQNLGEPLYLEDKEVNAIAMQEQEQRVFADSMVEKLFDYLVHEQAGFDTKCFSTGDLFKMGPLMDMREDKQNQMRVADALRSLGFTKAQIGNDRRRVWVPGTKWKAELGARTLNGANGKVPHHAEAGRTTSNNLESRLLTEKVQ
jgi:putative DNA primase/helicase